MADEKPYSIGFGKPPESTRFKKGQSGNPNGRPKGRLNIATALTRTLQEQVTINENGVRKKISKLDAALKQLVNQAAGGDLRAVQMLFALARSAEDNAIEPESTGTSEIDRKVMANVMMRFKRSLKHGEDEDAGE